MAWREGEMGGRGGISSVVSGGVGYGEGMSCVDREGEGMS